MRRTRLTTCLVAVCLVIAAVTAQAAAAKPGAAPGKMRGIVLPHGHTRARQAGTGNLQDNGGPVMHTNAVYAIYWVPAGTSVQPGYQSVISGFFSNVAAASGATSNVYYSDTQYYDSSGNISYSSAFNGAINATDPLPASGCSDSYTSTCLSDQQLQSEIAKVIAANHLPTGLGVEYFLFTPKNVGSCNGSSCSYSDYCAYHSNFTDGSSPVLYANMPYAAYVSSACGPGQSPNANDADATINVTSHEHNETITDPLGSAWYDLSGYENGDKCAWNFGSPLGGNAGAQYNQVIGSGHYYLQQEWSNQSSGCVLTGL